MLIQLNLNLNNKNVCEALKFYMLLFIYFFFFLGHSLGGESSKLYVKLQEMDQIIYNITENLIRYCHNSKEFAIMIMGDHGMTINGGHGGSSIDETFVPLIFIQKNINLINNNKTLNYKKQLNNVYDLQSMNGIKFNLYYLFNIIIIKYYLFNLVETIEQIDIAPTIIALLNLNKIPENNIGVSFYLNIETDLRLIASKIYLNLQNFIKILSNLKFKSLNDKNNFLGIYYNKLLFIYLYT